MHFNCIMNYIYHQLSLQCRRNVELVVTWYTCGKVSLLVRQTWLYRRESDFFFVQQEGSVQ